MKQVLLLLTVFLSSYTYCQDGSFDASFGASGISKINIHPSSSTGTNVNSGNVDDITKIAVQKDGKIIQVGFRSSSTGNDFVIIRRNKNGSADASFGLETLLDAGWTTTDVSSGSEDKAHSVVIQDDGKYIVAGEATISGKTFIALLRYNSDGRSLDATFDGDGA